VIPRLFDGELPIFNLGTNSGASCDPGLRLAVGAALNASGQTIVVDGRFKGGWITRAYGKPANGVETLQLELACRAYMHEPERPVPDNWPTPIAEERAAATRATIRRVLEAMLAWVQT
jgi:formiminoglutamase